MVPLSCENAFPRSPCPLAVGLEILGDRWTLLVLRDLFMGKSRFGDFLESPEGIPTNTLADRLKRLEEVGMVERLPYQERPVRHRYRLTERGSDTLPILQALVRWSRRHHPGTWSPPPGFDELTPEEWRRRQE